MAATQRGVVGICTGPHCSHSEWRWLLSHGYLCSEHERRVSGHLSFPCEAYGTTRSGAWKAEAGRI